MPHTEITDDFAFALYAQWEDAKAEGRGISLEQICAARPELLPDVREIARWLLPESVLFCTPLGGDSVPSGEHWVPPDWVKIGRGASSVVFRGQDPTFGTAVAFKVLQLQGPVDGARLMKRFEQEARILARLKHDGIVRIFKTFDLGSRPVIEMEHLPNGSLVTHLEEVRARGAAGIARFMERVARAVGFAHEHDIVHRDLKPSNILLNAENRPCVSDFGIAKLLGSDRDAPEPAPAVDPNDTATESACLTAQGRQPGTRAYMAPEQFDPDLGSTTPATDVWALGVILYELLTGRQPFTGRTFAEWKAAACTRPVEWPRRSRWRASGRLERIARRCLERNPKRRYRSATELADDLAALSRPVRWGALLLVGASVACAGLATGLLLHREPATTPAVSAPGAAPPAWINPGAATAITITDQLERGETVVACGAGERVAYRSVLGTPNVQAFKNRVTVYSSSEGAVELVPPLPYKGRYGVRVTLSHNGADTNMSLVGAFAGGCGWWTEASSGYRCFVVGFSDTGLIAGHKRGFGLHAVSPVGGSSTADSRVVWRESQPKQEPAVRVIEFRVGDGALESRLDAAILPPLTDTDLQARTAPTPRPNAPPHAPPLPVARGGIGVYVSGGFAVIRRVEVFPLLKTDH
ncbi:serine/threonine protein kinase [Gemmata sp. G18]|uniref:Serine/threonine protein kinase n=1 Tax=Gemmata palustris TaxID=2822762 RepID=A0ABS5BK54_9BACT|nr:serine/threonine-protein kinase [Gemmata palustris]MBP3954091.1 serine/threonine protein kinase [Gemmata palustris]